VTELERLAADYRDACRLVRALWLKLVSEPSSRHSLSVEYSAARHHVFETRKALLKLAAEATDDVWEVGG
jgi:hypothetical protein